MNRKYIIPQLSAQRLLSCAVKTEDGYSFSLDLTDPSKAYLVENTRQDDCPIFHQAMSILYGAGFHAEPVCEKLREVFVYLDFSGIFDRRPGKWVSDMQEKSEYMFTAEGVWLDFGHGPQRYIAFERSASMSRNSTISFLREDVYKPLRERMMLGMTTGKCQLSKLYAYNALLFTSGRRIKEQDFLTDRHIVVIDNPKTVVPNVHTVTVEDDGTAAPMRKYNRVEKHMDVEVTGFDGEGFISPRLAKRIDGTEGHLHHSFQIRLPYIKGVVHEVDFAELLAETKTDLIVDIWGQKHNPAEVDMILTKSMFKGIGWMTENGLSFGEYLDRCRKYDHALYISGVDKPGRQDTTELNYQFLNTLAITDEEFRPKNLPSGWKHSPREDRREWLTKATEAAYYDLIGAEADEARKAYFAADLDDDDLELTDRRRLRAEMIQENPLFLNEPVFAKELSDKANKLLEKYARGQLLVAGGNRYLSDDLLRLLCVMVEAGGGNSLALRAELLSGNAIYAPKPAYPEAEQYTLLRSPHIARNEEVLAVPLASVGPFRKKYLSHLHYVVMMDSRSLIPERLGGADFDGDMVKTITDPLVNRCIRRSSRDLPLLKIPAAEPLIADAQDWSARFATVKSTFSSRVGQISNTALSRGIIAYDENADDETKEECRKEVETLAILTGLEIDSAKSGVKPDLSEYLDAKKPRSLFLRYKSILDADERRKWYEASKTGRLKAFFSGVDWEQVSSNLEKLPFLARVLDSDTEKWTPAPADDAELFGLAPNWTTTLDPQMVERMAALIPDYETAQRRVRALRHSSMERKRESDIRRILYSRGQEREYSADELYAAFGDVLPEDIRAMRRRLDELRWHFTPAERRIDVLYEIAGQAHLIDLADLFCDFRCGGFRLLGDVICDLDDIYRSQTLERSGDSADLKRLLRGTLLSPDYKAQIVANCLAVLQPPDAKTHTDFAEAAKCAIALGKRQFALEVLPFATLALAKEGRARR